GKTERRSVEGKDFVAVQLFFDARKPDDMSWMVTVFFDPQVNYLVRKVTRDAMPGAKIRSHRDQEVVQFIEGDRSVFFSERVLSHDNLNEGQMVTDSTTVISGIRLNQPLPIDIFHIHFPASIYMTDTIRGVTYRIDAEGNPVSAEIPISNQPPSPILNAAVSG